MAIFGKPKDSAVKKKGIPDGLWTKCEECQKIIYNKALEENLKVCPKCNYHFTLSASERIAQLFDANSVEEFNSRLLPCDPLKFTGTRPYKDKLKEEQELCKSNDACIAGKGLIEAKPIIFCVTDSRFMMGSMGSVVGEKIARAAERAIEENLALIIVSGSGGGARMQEGMFSLMQMAKTSAMLARFHESGGLFVSILTNPTMAGVMASFASLGDIIIAEPRALIGFTGPRVIEQTIRQKLPPSFQRSEFLLEHGMIDMVVHRKALKTTLSNILDYLGPDSRKI